MSTGGNRANGQNTQQAREQAQRRTQRVIASLTLPHDRDAEVAMVGCLMLNPNLIDELQLRDGDFYHTDTKTLFGRICRIDAEIGAERIDPGTMLHELRRHNEMELVGGAANLARTLQAAPAGTALARFYARTLKEQAAERCLLNAANQVYEITQDDSLETNEKIERAEHAIFDVQAQTDDNGQTQTMRSLSNAVEAVIAEIEARRSTELRVEIPTGLAIDGATGGLRRKEVHVIAARPGVGKTSFAMQVALNAARNGADVLIISLEMSYTELIERLIANTAEISLTQIRNGNIGNEGMGRIHTAAHAVREIPITIEDRATLDILGVASAARRWARRNNNNQPKLIIIDYLQLIKPERVKGRDRTRQEEVSEMSRRVKGLARELDVAILLLAQLNRQSAEANRPPKLHDLRESGAIEQDADLVSFLWKAVTTAPGETPPATEQVELICEKNRNGPRGNYKLNFTGRFCRFRDAANEQQEAASAWTESGTAAGTAAFTDAATRAAGDDTHDSTPDDLFVPWDSQDRDDDFGD